MHMLSIQSSILHRWNDSRLAFNPEKYAGINNIYISSDLIWTPKLFLNDSYYSYGLGSCEPINCLVISDGSISCMFPCHQKARCKGNFSDWPFDIQKCSMVFTTLSNREDPTFDESQLSGTMIRSASNRWEILEVTATIDLADKSHVKFNYAIKRHDEIIYQHVIIPGLALITLTLSVLWMKHDSFLRLVLAGVCIHLHFSLMDRVWWQ